MALSPVSEAWVEHVYGVAQASFGSDDLSGSALASAVAQVSQLYTRQRTELSAGRTRTADLVARLKWFSLRDLPKVELPLCELHKRGQLPQADTWRVLDVGAGVGTSTLGVARVARRVGVQSLDVLAMDRDGDALRVFEKLAKDVSSLDATPITLRTLTADLTHLPQADKQTRFHLIVVGFVINELWPDATDDERAEQASAWLTQLSQQLTEDGALIVLEPALREQTRQLQRVRDRLAMTQQAPFVFAPCLRSGPCPMLDNDRDWCHAQVAFELPSKASEVARLSGLRDHDLTFSYLTLRRQAGHVGEPAETAIVTPDMSKQRIVSALLASKGKLELMACGEEGLSRVMRLDRHRTQDNAVVSALRRGAVVNLPVVGEDGRIRVTKDHRIEPDWFW